MTDEQKAAYVFAQVVEEESMKVNKEMVLTILVAWMISALICLVIIAICMAIWPASGPTVVIEIIGG